MLKSNYNLYNYKINAKIYFALNLPKDDGEYKITIRWVDKELSTK